MNNVPITLDLENPVLRFLALATVLAAVLIPAAPTTAQATNTLKRQQDALSRSLSRVRDKRNELRRELRKREAAANDMMRQVHAVDRRITSVENRLEDTQNRLARGKKRQEQLATELLQKTNRLDEVRQKVARRIRAMHVHGDTAPLAMLVDSDNIGDLAARRALIQRVAAKDRELFNEVRVLRDTVLEKKKEQDVLVAEIATLSEQLRVEAEELQKVRQEKKNIFSVLKAKENAIEEQLEDMARESRRLEAQIAEIQARTSGLTPVFRGRFIRPVNGRMSSGFGMRRHPVTGRTRMHNGVDIAAPTGTPIRAAGSGRVITAAYLRGYGYTVIVDHGGGVSTLYAHCSSILVRVGQSVQTGQTIARVGSTGLSTGPHLHFEIRINGRPINPVGRI